MRTACIGIVAALLGGCATTGIEKPLTREEGESCFAHPDPYDFDSCKRCVAFARKQCDAKKPSAACGSFFKTMTLKPRRLAGLNPLYGSKVLHQTGVVLVECVLLASGRFENCKYVKATPGFDLPENLKRIETWVMQPATLCGAPTAVKYVVPIRFLPQPGQ